MHFYSMMMNDEDVMARPLETLSSHVLVYRVRHTSHQLAYVAISSK